MKIQTAVVEVQVVFLSYSYKRRLVDHQALEPPANQVQKLLCAANKMLLLTVVDVP